MAVLVILVAVVVIAVDRGQGKNDTATASDSGSSQSQPQWPNDASHPPKGLEGSGAPSKGAAPLPAGVYFWYAFGWKVVVEPGQGVGPLTITVADPTASPDPAKQLDVKLDGAAPQGVTATNPTRSTLKLEVTPASGPVRVKLDVNGFIHALSWTFDGIDPALVHLGTSAKPISSSPITVTKTS